MVALKCVFVGDQNVGKSTLIMNYADRKCGSDIPTVVDACSVPVFFDGRSVMLKVWDSGGHRDYDSIRPLLYPESDVCVVCFSVADFDSYENVGKKWVPELNQHRPNTPILLVATKTDLRENVEEEGVSADHSGITYEMGVELGHRINAVVYTECSALTLEGVKRVFQDAARIVTHAHKPSSASKSGCTIL